MNNYQALGLIAAEAFMSKQAGGFGSLATIGKTLMQTPGKMWNGPVASVAVPVLNGLVGAAKAPAFVKNTFYPGTRTIKTPLKNTARAYVAARYDYDGNRVFNIANTPKLPRSSPTYPQGVPPTQYALERDPYSKINRTHRGLQDSPSALSEGLGGFYLPARNTAVSLNTSLSPDMVDQTKKIMRHELAHAIQYNSSSHASPMANSLQGLVGRLSRSSNPRDVAWTQYLGELNSYASMPKGLFNQLRIGNNFIQKGLHPAHINLYGPEYASVHNKVKRLVNRGALGAGLGGAGLTAGGAYALYGPKGNSGDQPEVASIDSASE